MPELPEVETTTSLLGTLVVGKTIVNVWTDLESAYYSGKDTIKDPAYFIYFKKEVVGKRVVRIRRRAKNILIELSSGSIIVVHMKMTGHLLYGTYKKIVDTRGTTSWVPTKKNTPLSDPFNRFIHVVFEYGDGTHLVLCDMRKFATVKLIPDQQTLEKTFSNTGPEPLHPTFSWQSFKKALSRKPNGKIKTVLMDHTIIAGIGNIYSDEILWASGIHPERKISTLKDLDYKNLHTHIQELLSKGIDFGGDSMSDYRNPHGLPGDFQKHHEAYRRTGKACRKKDCKGTIARKVISGRSAHFCDTHQI